MYIQRWLAAAWIAVAISATQVAAAQELSKQSAAAIAPARRLDLRAPKITDILSPQAIELALRTTRDPDTLEEVEVEGRRPELEPRTPVVPGGIAAPFWALLHPTQAWRILAPLPPDQTSGLDEPALDATDPYRAPTLPPM